MLFTVTLLTVRNQRILHSWDTRRTPSRHHRHDPGARRSTPGNQPRHTEKAIRTRNVT
jgi:hypothetical protein